MTWLETKRVIDLLLRMQLRTIQCLVVSAALSVIVLAQEGTGSFRCDSHTVAIDRMPGARFSQDQETSPANLRKILEADFSGFDSLYSLDSLHFEILFEQDKSNGYRTVGTMRIRARVRNRNGDGQWRELSDEGTRLETQPEGWYSYWPVSKLLRVGFEKPGDGEQAVGSDDPSIERWGRPQVVIQQAAKNTPVFLLKFIGLTRAGGWGDVDTEQAIVLDFRTAELAAAPAAVGCVKNDFAGQTHEDEWIQCLWSPRYADYVCRTNAYYQRDWDFLLTQGKELSPKKESGRP